MTTTSIMPKIMTEMRMVQDSNWKDKIRIASPAKVARIDAHQRVVTGLPQEKHADQMRGPISSLRHTVTAWSPQ
jgi:hypothetical protein